MKTSFSPEAPLHRRLLSEQFPAGAEWQGSLSSGSERIRSAGIELLGPMRWSAQLHCSPERGADWVDLQAEGPVGLSCTRCLADLQPLFSMDRRFRLFDTAIEADEALSLEDGLEETLSTEDSLSLVSLLEDELLLSAEDLMQHADCALAVQAEPEARQRPFADLASLLHPKDKQ